MYSFDASAMNREARYDTLFFKIIYKAHER